jgi:hypothetical protein
MSSWFFIEDSIIDTEVKEQNASNRVKGQISGGSNTDPVIVGSGLDRLMVVMTVEATSVTYNGDSFTNHAYVFDGFMQIWYLTAPDTGTHDLVVTGTNDTFYSATTFINVDQTTPLGASDADFNSGSPQSITLSAGLKDMVIAFTYTINAEPIPDSSQTEWWSDTWNNGVDDEYVSGSFIQGVGGDTSIEYTFGASPFDTIIGTVINNV